MTSILNDVLRGLGVPATTQRQNRRVYIWAASYATARLFSQGLANFFALETLRHGTNPLYWLSIHTLGALPSAGGNRGGGDYGQGFDHQNRNRFYCAYNVDLFESNYQPETHFKNYPLIDRGDKYLRRAGSHFVWRVSRRSLNAFSAYCLSKTYTFSSMDNITGRTAASHGAEGVVFFYTLITPNIKFHLSQERIERDFEGDVTYPRGFACSTDKWIAPINSGLMGVIWNSLTYKTAHRMYNNPKKVLIGLTQISLAVGTAALAYHLALPVIQEHRWAALVGAVLAVI